MGDNQESFSCILAVDKKGCNKIFYFSFTEKNVPFKNETYMSEPSPPTPHVRTP